MSQGYCGTATALAICEPVTVGPAREFAFSDADFRSLAQYAYEQAGIALSDTNRNLVYSRLSRRLRALEMTSFREYRAYLAANAISTNLTKFFRRFNHNRCPHARARSGTDRLEPAVRLLVDVAISF